MRGIKLGFAPTRRSIFSAPDAVKYRDLTEKRLKELGIDFVDITDINEEGLLYDDADMYKIAEKFKKEKIDGLFFPHCNFGTEYECARLAKELGVPVLLWGPLDERPEADGTRLRDTQCGLFATGKVLRRFGIPFTYMTNCRLDDPVFARGLQDFLAVCNVVRTFRNIRILQISTRPFDFWTTMCNEGELLERFNIQLSPISMPELTDEIKRAKEEGGEVAEVIRYCRENMQVQIKDDELENVAALKVAMKHLIDRYGCQAAAIQCWNQLQSEIGIMPCAANSLLNEEGIPGSMRDGYPWRGHGAFGGGGRHGRGEEFLCRLDDPASGCGKRRIAAALRPVADLRGERDAEDHLPVGVRPSGQHHCGGKTRGCDFGAVRRGQWRIFPAPWKCKRDRRAKRHGHVSVGRSGEYQKA